VGKKLSAEEVASIMEDKGVTAKQLKEMLSITKPTIKVNKPKKTKRYTFGVVSDTHLTDKACALSELHQFYEVCRKRGIKEVVNAGDVSSGLSVYPGQINDLECFGFEDHLAYVVEHYPKVKGIQTFFISGN